MKGAIIENGVVTNVILLPENFQGDEWGGKPLVVSDEAAIGDSYVEGVFVKPEVPPETPEQAVARLKSELDAIERAEIMPRKTREIQIQLMEFLAAQQGIPPEQLAQNPAYAGMKAVDAQCVALRQQIRDLEP